MKRLTIILFFLITTIYSLIGCNEIISITGLMMNRLNNQEFPDSEIKVLVRNENNKNINGFQVYIIESSDSQCIFNPQFTQNDKNVSFIFPDDQINVIKKESVDLLVIVDHPLIGVFSQSIDFKQLQSGKPVLIEFNIGAAPENLSMPDKSKYLKFKY